MLLRYPAKRVLLRIVLGVFMLPYISRSTVTPADATDAIRACAEELRRDVTELATDIGPRGYFAKDKYALAEGFLFSALRNAGYDVHKEPVVCCDGSIAHNLIAEIKGTHTPHSIIVAGAHYDSVENCPAANDNASGVAGVLALARMFSGKRCKKTVRFVLFANEEPPHFNMNAMGSQHHARACRKRKENISGMFCLETIGCYSNAPGSQQWPHPMLATMLGNVGDFIAFVGPTACKPFLEKCKRAFAASNSFTVLAAAAPASIDQLNWSDHRGFCDEGYEGFMITDTAPLRYKHYHKASDTPEKLDYITMARVVCGVGTMLESVSNEV